MMKLKLNDAKIYEHGDGSAIVLYKTMRGFWEARIMNSTNNTCDVLMYEKEFITCEEKAITRMQELYHNHPDKHLYNRNLALPHLAEAS